MAYGLDDLSLGQALPFLLTEGSPGTQSGLAERYGPIVMSTQAELRQPALELQNGTFIKP